MKTKSIGEQLRAQAELMSNRPLTPSPGNTSITYSGIEIVVTITPGEESGNSTYSELSFRRNSREAIHVVRDSETELVLGITGSWELEDILYAFKQISGYTK